MKQLTRQIKRIAKENNLPESIVKEIYESQFKFIRQTIEAMDLKNMTEEEFEKLKCIFSLKYLGKFHTNWNVIKKINKEKHE